MADPFADIPIKGESKDPFADIPVKPSFGEKAEGFVYGLATGIPGMLGDIETMLDDKFDELDQYIHNVDFLIDIDKVVSTIQPETDKVLKGL